MCAELCLQSCMSTPDPQQNAKNQCQARPETPTTSINRPSSAHTVHLSRARIGHPALKWLCHSQPCEANFVSEECFPGPRAACSCSAGSPAVFPSNPDHGGPEQRAVPTRGSDSTASEGLSSPSLRPEFLRQDHVLNQKHSLADPQAQPILSQPVSLWAIYGLPPCSQDGKTACSSPKLPLPLEVSWCGSEDMSGSDTGCGDGEELGLEAAAEAGGLTSFSKRRERRKSKKKGHR